MATPTRPSLSPAAERAARLFAEHGPAVLRFARRRCPDLADDVLSETFAIAVRRADEIPHGKELPWLYVVAEHVLRNQLRSQQRARRFEHDLQPLTHGAAPAPDLPTVGPELDELPDRERLLLVMTALEGLSAAEAAERMGIPYGSARNALVSARRNLAMRLAAAGVAVAASLLLVLVLMLSADRSRAPRTVARALDRTITASRSVHEVAVVRRGSDRHGQRYERWSQLDARASTVELPSGRALTTHRDETLRAAAHRARVPLDARAVADLDALQVTAPEQLQAMLANPAVRASATRGPNIAGRPTTTFTGRRTDPADRTFAVRVLVADDGASVLEARTRRLAASGAVTGTPTTVQFAAWEAQPRDPQDATGASTPASPTTPGTAASGRASDASAAAQPHGPAAAWHAPTPTQATQAAGHASARDVRELAAVQAPSQPILHVRTIEHLGPARDAVNSSVASSQEVEGWYELGGADRFRVRFGWQVIAIREQWYSGLTHGWWALDQWGKARVHEGRLQHQQRPYGRGGGWLVDAAAFIGAHAHDADLPAGTTLDGQPAVMLAVTMRSGQTGQVALDPATRTPLQFATNPTANQAVWLMIKHWELVPAGPHATLLDGHPPRDRDLS